MSKTNGAAAAESTTRMLRELSQNRRLPLRRDQWRQERGSGMMRLHVHVSVTENPVAHREEAWLMERRRKEPLFVALSCSAHPTMSLPQGGHPFA